MTTSRKGTTPQGGPDRNRHAAFTENTTTQKRGETDMYMLSMRGCKPSYYDTEEEARKSYITLCRYYSGVSLRRISYNRFLKDCLVTGRTA